MATLKTTVAQNADLTVELREQASGSVDVIVKDNGRKARLFRILGRSNNASKRGSIAFGRKADALAAMGFQVVDGRVAIASTF